MQTLEALKQSRSVLLSQQTTMVIKKQEDSPQFARLSAEIADLDERIAPLQQIENLRNSSAMKPETVSASSPLSVRRQEAFRNYLKTGDIQTRDLATTTDAGGAAVVPVEYTFGAFARKYYAPLTDYVNYVESDNGRAHKVSFLDATTTPGLTLISEDSTSSPFVEEDPVMSSANVWLDLFSSGAINVSYQELSDASDLDSLLKRVGAQRYGTGLETVLTAGHDSASTPNTTPNNPGLLSGIQSGKTFQTSAIANGIKYTDFISTLETLDAAYLRAPKAAVMMHETTRLWLASQLDSTGRPLWNPDPKAAFDSILGLPLLINNSLPTLVSGAFVANSLPILVGDFGSYATVLTDGKIRVTISRERRAEYLEAVLYFAARVGSTICNKNAVAAVKIAAS